MNNTFNGSTYKPGSAATPLSSKLQAFASATMNKKATAIMKTVSIVNPYSDDLAKATKNIN